MASVNKVILLGRLGQDPELKTTESGKTWCNFSMATSSVSGKDDDKKEVTEWHNVTTFGKTAELAAKYLAKGSQVYIEGRLQTRKYEKDGEQRYSTSIIAYQIVFCGSGSGGESKKNEPPPYDDNDFPM